MTVRCSVLALLFAGLAACIVLTASHAHARKNPSATVRVLIIEAHPTVTVTASRMTATDDRGRTTGKFSHAQFSRAGRFVDMAVAGVGSKKAHSFRVAPQNGVITVDGRAYRGVMEVWPASTGDLAVVNDVGYDEYLASVLGSEMDATWPAEALKAQAVVARTYAMTRARSLRMTTVPAYDLKATVQDQVYTGVAGEAESTRAAASGTHGQVLMFNGELAQVHYHSTCGGRTLSAASVWGKDIPYLRGVECGFCEDSPRYFWTHTITLEDLRRKLAEAGYRLDTLTGLKANSTSTLDPVQTVQCQGRPRKIAVSGADLRRIVGYHYIFSTRFTLREEPAENAYTFLGSGAGHGVGLCQWGARGMAAEGIEYLAIVQKYFPGTETHTLY